MQLGLSDRAAIVTGGSVGIGKGIADALASEGCDVVICARSEEALEAAAADLADRDGDVLPVVADVTDGDDVERLVARTDETFGGADVLVNNVGTLGSEKRFHEIPDDEWRHVFETNIMSAVMVTRAVLPRMREQGWGRIVNVASEAGTQPDAFKTHYDATKAALISFTKNLSKTYGEDGVLVNAVSPSTTVTPLVEEIFEDRAEETGLSMAEVERRFLEDERPEIVVGRLCEPSDVGSVVAFLASEAASFVTGSNYRIDGGSISTMDA